MIHRLPGSLQAEQQEILLYEDRIAEQIANLVLLRATMKALDEGLTYDCPECGHPLPFGGTCRDCGYDDPIPSAIFNQILSKNRKPSVEIFCLPHPNKPLQNRMLQVQHFK